MIMRLAAIAGATTIAGLFLAAMNTTAPAPPVVKTAVTAEAIAHMHDGCDMPNAIPDCHAEVARIVSIQAMHPEWKHAQAPAASQAPQVQASQRPTTLGELCGPMTQAEALEAQRCLADVHGGFWIAKDCCPGY